MAIREFFMPNKSKLAFFILFFPVLSYFVFWLSGIRAHCDPGPCSQRSIFFNFLLNDRGFEAVMAVLTYPLACLVEWVRKTF